MNTVIYGRKKKNTKKRSPLFPVAAICTALCAAICISFFIPTEENIPVSASYREENGFWEDYSRFAAGLFEAIF